MENIINGVTVENMNRVTLCGRPNRCCPTLERLSDGRYVLTDDDGHSVIITREQAQLINNGMNVIEGNALNEQLLCE